VANGRFDKQCLTISYRTASGSLRSVDRVYDKSMFIVLIVVEGKSTRTMGVCRRRRSSLFRVRVGSL
jgi:hypothetical protein